MAFEQTVPDESVDGAARIDPMQEQRDLPLLLASRLCRLASVSFHLAYLEEQMGALRQAGVSIEAVCTEGPELDRIREVVPCTAITIERAITPIADLRSLWHLYRHFRRGRFDIVHSNTPKGGLLSAIAGALARVPIRLHTFTGQPWETMGPGVTRSLTIAADRLIIRLNTQCYADGESQVRNLVAEGVAPAHSLRVIGEGSLAGVDPDRFDPGRWSADDRRALRSSFGLRANSTVICLIGRLSEHKGVYELRDAFDRLVAGGADVELLLIGPLEDGRGSSPAAAAEELLINDRVVLAGYLEHPEEALAVTDIFCLPSHREGYPTVVLEAAAMGLPTVGTRVTGVVDAVNDSETGMLVPLRSVDELYAALHTLVHDPELRTELGARARQRCIESFTQLGMAAMVAEEYERVLANRSSSQKTIPTADRSR